MPLVTGILKDANGNPLFGEIVAVTVAVTNNPSSGGLLICNTSVKAKSNPTNGVWQIQLAGGSYTVVITYNNASSPTNLAFTVPTTGGPYSVDTLVSTPPPTPYYSTTGAGDPTGVVSGNPGSFYVDVAGGALWVKLINTDATGWQKFIQL